MISKFKRSRIFLFSTILLLSIFLAACAGGAGQVGSWPGVSIDPNGEVAYVASNTHVYAVNLANGTQKWRYPAEPEKNVSFYASPALKGDGQLIASGYDFKVHSLTPENGQQNWVFAQATNRFIGGPLVNGDTIFAPNSDNFLYAIDSAGGLRWKFEVEESLWGAPATDGVNIYLSSMDHRVYALEAESGKLVWKTDDLGGSIAVQPLLSEDGVLYVGTFGSEMIALSIQNGGVLWRTPTNGWVYSRPVLVDGVLYFGDLDGTMFALNASDGSVRWQTQPNSATQREISGAPLVMGDTVYFISKAGIFYALDVASGSVRWSKNLPQDLGDNYKGKYYSDVLASGDTILLAPMGASTLVAMDPNGNPKWTFIPPK